MENAKQEAIKKAYGEYWEQIKDYVDENGWYDPILNTFTLQQDLKIFEFCEKKINENEVTNIFRPKSLNGIENNNGWVRVNNEADLPKENGSYWIEIEQQISNTPFWYNNETEEFNFGSLIFDANQITHYQPIEKPLKPLY